MATDARIQCALSSALICKLGSDPFIIVTTNSYCEQLEIMAEKCFVSHQEPCRPQDISINPSAGSSGQRFADKRALLGIYSLASSCPMSGSDGALTR